MRVPAQAAMFEPKMPANFVEKARLRRAGARSCYTRTFVVVTHTAPHPECCAGPCARAGAGANHEVIDLMQEIHLTDVSAS